MYQYAAATTRLRELLNERGVEWWPSDDRRCEDVITNWQVGPLDWTAFDNETVLDITAEIAGYNFLTPEQVIDVTIGAHDYTYDQWRDISDAVADAMTYAHDKAIEHPDHADPLWNLDEYVNRILKVAFDGELKHDADTCSLTQKSWDNGTSTWGVECSACHARFEHETGITWKFCPSCRLPIERSHLN